MNGLILKYYVAEWSTKQNIGHIEEFDEYLEREVSKNNGWPIVGIFKTPEEAHEFLKKYKPE